MRNKTRILAVFKNSTHQDLVFAEVKRWLIERILVPQERRFALRNLNAEAEEPDRPGLGVDSDNESQAASIAASAASGRTQLE